jgi:hypothetical protein
MKTKDLYIILIRPVGSHCWTTQTISNSNEHAEKHAQDLRHEKVVFADGSAHLQSTRIVCVQVPSDVDIRQMHYPVDHQ